MTMHLTNFPLLFPRYCIYSKQVSVMFKTFAGTVGWQLWQWFFAGGEGCGFQWFPIFGLTAAERGCV